MPDEMKASHPKKTLIRLWSYLKKYRFKLMVVTIMMIVTTVVSVIGPLLMGIILDDFIIALKMEGFIFIILILLFIYIINSILDFLINFIMIKVSEDTLYSIRKKLFNHLEHLSLPFFDKNKKGDIMSRFTNDIAIISEALSEAVIQVVGSVIMLVGVTVIMFVINPVLAMLIILTVPILFVLAFIIGKKASVYFLEQQNNLGTLNSYAEEVISGIKVVKSYAKEDDANTLFNKHNDKLKKTVVKAQLFASLIIPANLIVTNIGNILLIAVGSFMIIDGKLTIGELLAFISYAAMFRQPINQLASLFSSIGHGLAGAERVFEIMDTRVDIVSKRDAITLPKINGDVVLKNVFFGYDANLVLNDISITAKSGQKIAIVGKTGAGKTTIINLIPRFYDVVKGQVLIDGIDVRNIKIADLRKKIGIVLQDTYLFKGTIRENICYGNENSPIEQIILASKKAFAHSFIKRLPAGYDSLVDFEGSNFSQGERQLISIARAILANPDILILDEATSSIDTKTEGEIIKGMQELMKSRTSFVVAHRLSTIREADVIIVLDKGKIVESGDHQCLLKKRGVYYSLYNDQLE
ncbi:MAG: ABC transporter ATP-binding protein [Bacilli bacterium]